MNQPTLTTVPELYWQQERSAVARLAESNLQAAISHHTETGIVISQTPAPGTQVKVGTTVSITIGQPQLVLTASAPTVKTNQAVEFTATLEPPLPATFTMARTFVPPQPKYSFDLGDNTQTGPSDSTSVSHSYSTAQSYNATAKVQIGSLSLASNPVTITVENPVQAPAYQVTLDVEPRIVATGKQVVASVNVSPPPPSQATYIFLWGEGTPDTSQVPRATHTYNPPARRHLVQAIVSINGTEIRSNPKVVQVTVPIQPQPPAPAPEPPQPIGWPLWQIVVAVVAAVLILGGAYKLLRSKKLSSAAQPPHVPESLSVIAKQGLAHHEIHKPETIRTRPTVTIRSGSAVSTSLKPAQGIARKRSASNA